MTHEDTMMTIISRCTGRRRCLVYIAVLVILGLNVGSYYIGKNVGRTVPSPSRLLTPTRPLPTRPEKSTKLIHKGKHRMPEKASFTEVRVMTASRERETSRLFDIGHKVTALRKALTAVTAVTAANWTSLQPPATRVASVPARLFQNKDDLYNKVLRETFKFELRPRRNGSMMRVGREVNLFVSEMLQRAVTGLSQLEPHQLVNRLPGVEPITRKMILSSIRSGLSCVKPGFNLEHETEQFTAYIKKHPKSLWVQKGRNHRRVKLIDVKDIFNATFKLQKQVFYQEFISNSLLIDNRKFDVGIHGLFTSAQPLRYYVDFGDWNIKFCSQDYLPFDKNVREKFVEGEIFTRTQEIESMAKYMFRDGMSKKEALYQNLRDQGYSVNQLEARLIAAFSEIGAVKDREVLSGIQQTRYSRTLKDYKNRNFYEFVRFDVSLDNKLKPWIVECNKDPQVQPPVKMRKLDVYTRPVGESPYARYFNGDQHKMAAVEAYLNTTMPDMIRSMMLLAGVPLSQTGVDETEKVPDDQINVDTGICRENCSCAQCCDEWECSVCWQCLHDEDRLEMRRSYIEHFRRGDWRRVAPTPFKNQNDAKMWNPKVDKLYQRLEDKSQRLFLWFRLKCLQLEHWCQ